MSVRANVMWEDRVWDALQEVPKGERSRLVNQAVSEMLLRNQRQRAQEQMRKLRAIQPRLKVKIVDELQRDRARGA